MTRLVSACYADFYPFENLYSKFHCSISPSELEPGDTLLVWGGEDISPSLYNRSVSKYTGARAIPSRRDTIEWGMMQRAKEIGAPIIGICRGAQMLCALAGGFLLQHVNNHPGGRHIVTTNDGDELITNSLHHQMMYPFDVKHEMLASIKRQGQHYDVEVLVDVPEDPEFVYFPEVKGMAVQWHPEMMDEECAATKFIHKQMVEKLGV